MSNITFSCMKDGRHPVKLNDAKNVYYQYTSRNGVMARGTCPKHGSKITQFISKDKVPSGEKIRAAEPAGKKSAKKGKSQRRSNRSNRNSRKSH